MSRARIYARNIFSNYAGQVANLVVMFFLSPFVVHQLGDATYGAWSLVVSLTGYLGLAELGVRAGLGRYVNWYLGKGDIPRVNGVISTALAFFAATAVPLLAVSAVVSALFHVFFPKVPPELLDSARLAVLIVAVNLWLSFIGACFAQVLTAFDRFDLSNAVNVGVLLIRAGGTVAVLALGGGLVELAAVQAASSAAGAAGAYLLARRVFPQLALRASLLSRRGFRELFGFSVWAFIASMAARIVYWSDIVVIAILIGMERVTFYSIAGMLIIHGRASLDLATGVFYPQIVKHCARSNWRSLQRFFSQGASMAMSVAIPLLVGFIVFGREFIGLWMGPKYRISYPVLAILSFSQFPAVAVALGSAVFSGLGRVRFGALVGLSQAVANLGLTLLFVMALDMGIEGVAWGTFYPRVVLSLLAGVMAMRWIHLPIGPFVARRVSRWVATGLLFAAGCMAINELVSVGGWGGFALKVALSLAAYVPMAWLVLLGSSDRLQWRGHLSALFVRAGVSPVDEGACEEV